jgi:hypothetical protein
MSDDIGKGDLVEYVGGMSPSCGHRCNCRWPFSVGEKFTVERTIVHSHSKGLFLELTNVKVGYHRKFRLKYFRKVRPARDWRKWLDQPVEFDGFKRSMEPANHGRDPSRQCSLEHGF